MARLTTSKFRSLLEQRVKTVDNDILVVSGRSPDMPDRVVAIRRGTGRGSTVDGAYENTSWFIESRGRQNDLDDSENISKIVDDILLTISNEAYQGTRILAADWAGGGPQQLIAADPQSRYSYVGNYTVESER